MNSYDIFKSCNFIEEKDIDTKKYIKLNESNTFYDPLNYSSGLNYIVSGYFQSYKYFLNNIDKIKEILFANVASEYDQIKEYFYNNYANDSKQTCLIHVRRGDYLKYPNIHPLCSDKYYYNGINYINEKFNGNIRYILFSDDIEYLKSWNVIKNVEHKIVSEKDSVKTLLLMTLCDHYIIANSSLSLCGYFLRKNLNGTIIGPKNWFGKNLQNYKINDILPDNAIIL